MLLTLFPPAFLVDKTQMPRGAQRESVALAQSHLLIADRKRRKRRENWKTKKNWKTEYKSNAISSHDYVENSYVRLMATHCTACANFPGNSSWEGQGLVNILPLFWIRFFVYFCWYVFCSGPDNPTGRCLRSADAQRGSAWVGGTGTKSTAIPPHRWSQTSQAAWKLKNKKKLKNRIQKQRNF